MAIYRVSSTGSDSASGSLSAPWQTLGKLATMFPSLVGGDVVVIDPGVTHNSAVTPLLFSGMRFGSLVKFIMGGGGLGTKPSITGSDTAVGVTLTNVSNLQISDWVIRNANDYGLATNLVTDIVIHGFEIKDIIGTGIGFSYYDQDLDEGRDFIVEHCYVHDTTGDGTTSISAIRTQVRYCHFKNHGVGQASNLVDGVAFHGVKKDFCEVHHCIIENVEGKSGIGANFNGALVEYNHITYPGLSCDIDVAAQTIEKTHGPAWSAGFSVGDYFKVTNSENSENNGIYLIDAILSTHKVRVSTAVPWATETQYVQGFTTTNHADGTANLKRMDGSRVYSHHNYLRDVSTQGINSLEVLSVSIAQNNVIVMPNRWFGRPFVNVTVTFTAAAKTLKLLGGSMWGTKFSVGDLFYVSSANPSVVGLYKISVLAGDTVTMVTTAPGVRDPAYRTTMTVTGDVLVTIEYATPFGTGIGGLVASDGVMYAHNNTIYNRSKSEDPLNVVYSAASMSTVVFSETAGTAGELINNISVCVETSSRHLTWDTTYPSIIDYNCYWPDDENQNAGAAGVGRFFVINSPIAQSVFRFYEWNGFHDTHSVSVNPLFIGDPATDPRYAALEPTSSCIGVGSDLSANAVMPFSDDYRGRPRPDGAWDIGAMQVGGDASTSYRTNRTAAHVEVQVSGSGCLGVRLSVTFETGDLARSAGVLLYRVYKPADYATVFEWRSAEVASGVVMLARDLDPTSLYFVEILTGRLKARVQDRVVPTNLERFREPEDAYSDAGASGAFVEIGGFIADVGADVRPIDWSAVVADPFNVLLIGNDAEDGIVLGSAGERLADGTRLHYASLVCSAVAADMTTERRCNLITTAYTDQRMLALQFPHVFADGTTVASLADYKAGVGRLSTGELVARAQHQSDPGSAGALFGHLTLLRTYEPDPHLVVFALGAADMAEYDSTDTTWETTAATAMATLITQTMTGYDHMPRVLVVLPPVAGPVNAAGEDVVRKALSTAVATVISAGARSLDVGLVDLLADAALAAQNLGPWDVVLTRAQHAWLGRSGGAFDTAVRAAFAHVLP